MKNGLRELSQEKEQKVLELAVLNAQADLLIKQQALIKQQIKELENELGVKK